MLKRILVGLGQVQYEEILYDHSPVLSGIILVVGSSAAERSSSISMSFLSNCEIENASAAASEVSLSPSGRRKATAPSGAVAGLLVDVKVGQKVVGPGGDLGAMGATAMRSLDNRCCSNCPRNHQSPVWE